MSSTSNDLRQLERQLWKTAEALRGSMDATEYSNVVLGLIFLKYLSDSFEYENYKLINSQYPSDAKDKYAYIADNVFWLPKTSRWGGIRKLAHNPNIGQIIDSAMDDIERENKSLRGILPKNYASPDINSGKLGQVVDVVSNIKMNPSQSKGKDIFGRVYEYFLNKFAAVERRGGGEFYTPQSVVRTLVEMIEPYKGRVYDPCCGSGGMFVQSKAFVEKHRGNINNISIFGQESNPQTWKLCKMNLAIRGIDSDLGPHQGDTLANDLHKGERFNYILANPPFNMSWNRNALKNDPRWIYGVPTTGTKTGNFIWLQHVMSKLSINGKAGIVLANGALTTQRNGQDDIRKNIVNSNKLDAIVALPGQMFYSTPIPASLWIINNNKHNACNNNILFIDASKLGNRVDRTHRNFSDKSINLIASTYHNYCKNSNSYKDVIGFCKKIPINKVKENEYALTPSSYVGFKKKHINKDTLRYKIKDLSNKLSKQMLNNRKLGCSVQNYLKEINSNSISIFDNDNKSKLVKLSDVAHDVNDRAKRKHLIYKAYIPINMIPKHQLFSINYKSNSEAKSSLIYFHKNDILFGAMRPYFHRLMLAPFNGITRTTTIVIRPNNAKILPFLSMRLFQNDFIKYAYSHCKGSTMPYDTWDTIKNFKFSIPENLTKFNKIFNIIRFNIYNFYLENDDLLKIEKTLLNTIFND